MSGPATVLRPGDAGPSVAALHQALVEAGEVVDPAELADTRYGSSTMNAVAVFQSAHKLDADGLCGPRTWAALTGGTDSRYTADGWRCEPSQARPGLVEVLRAAVGCIGEVERPPGSNRSPKIDRWNAEAGIPIGSPWCASWCCAMYAVAARPIPRMGSAYKVAEWGRMRGLLVDGLSPLLAGDIGVILRGDGHGHVVLVAGDVSGNGNIATIEGNSGGACRGLIRPRTSFACFVRPLV